jgi:hypothetical protein
MRVLTADTKFYLKSLLLEQKQFMATNVILNDLQF